jgi:hypothetical protein
LQFGERKCTMLTRLFEQVLLFENVKRGQRCRARKWVSTKSRAMSTSWPMVKRLTLGD